MSKKRNEDGYTTSLIPGIPYNIELQRSELTGQSGYLERVSSGYDDIYDCDENETGRKKELTPHEFLKWRRAILIFLTIAIILQAAVSIVSVVVGMMNDSSGTFGFGVEALMDILTSIIVIWRYTGKDGFVYSAKKERKSVLILATIMVVFAIGIAVKGLLNLTQEAAPFEIMTLLTIVIISITLYIGITYGKFWLAAKIQSESLYLDGICSVFGLCLLIVLLISLIVYRYTGLWILDDIVALLIAFVMVLYSVRIVYKELTRSPEKEGLT